MDGVEASNPKARLLLLVIAAVGVISCQQHSDKPSNSNSKSMPTTVEGGERVSEAGRYHCENNRVIEVDWMASDGHPRLRTEAHPQWINMTLSGNDYAGDGYSLNGVETTPTIGLAWPRGKMQVCQKVSPN